ncbi:MAG: hypothetical protein AAFW89_02050 [Bacteroidota bacterium]
MKLFISIALLLFGIGCHQQPSRMEMIQGNWKQTAEFYPEYISVGYAHFIDDRFLLHNYEYQKFEIREDSLVFTLNRPFEHHRNGLTKEKYYIIGHISQDSLVIIEHMEYWDGFDVGVDTVKHLFRRFTPRANQPRLSRIEFASGWCYGYCPQRDVIIDSSGYLYYGPHRYDTVQTPLTSQDARELFDEISFLLSSIPVSFLDTLSGTYNVDAQRLVTHLYFENGLEKQLITDDNNSLLPIFMKLEHAVNFVPNLKPTDPIKLEVRDKVRKIPN